VVEDLRLNIPAGTKAHQQHMLYGERQLQAFTVKVLMDPSLCIQTAEGACCHVTAEDNQLTPLLLLTSSL
jgi:hypothetical protein